MDLTAKVSIHDTLSLSRNIDKNLNLTTRKITPVELIIRESSWKKVLAELWKWFRWFLIRVSRILANAYCKS